MWVKKKILNCMFGDSVIQFTFYLGKKLQNDILDHFLLKYLQHEVHIDKKGSNNEAGGESFLVFFQVK